MGVAGIDHMKYSFTDVLQCLLLKGSTSWLGSIWITDPSD